MYAKYTYELKLKIVKEYLAGEGGYEFLAKKYNIPGKDNVYNWIKIYKEFGEDGLRRKRNNKKYTLDFKLDMIKSYLTTEISYQELALKHGMTTPNLISAWVSKYRQHGIEGLSKQQGRPYQMKPDVKRIISKDFIKSDYVKKLEIKILEQEIEIAYLKELRRLRLKGKQRKKKSQE